MTFLISAGAVQLEASLRKPEGEPQGAVVVCHPHPVYGGTMDNRVVYRASRAAASAGFTALRFNFRGVGKSSGHFDHGMGEKEDVRAAIRWLEERYRGLDLAVIGYSFGAWVGLQVASADPRIKLMTGLALPLDLYDFGFLDVCPKPALYVIGTRDEFCSAEKLDLLAAQLPATATLHKIEGSDHFFSGHIEAVQDLITDFFSKRGRS